jgi:peptide-methionine (S)-S-oxide reductase
MAMDVATFGGGCFWCTEAVFQQLRGVKRVEPGYSGGQVLYPRSEQVAEGDTGHAEVVRVHFDSEVISYRALLEILFTIHDPTTLNRQGNDIGTQYRSVIFSHSAEQDAIARKVIEEIACVWDEPIVTELSSAPEFYPAEDYHQNYYKLNAQHNYCTLVVAPKVRVAREFISQKMRGQNIEARSNYSASQNIMTTYS